MPRTSWEDLLDEGPAGHTPAAGAPSLAQVTRGADPAAARAPRSLDEVPELSGLLAEKRRLEDNLRQLTGQGGGGARPEDARDARRFPILEKSSPESRMELRRTDRQDEEQRDAGRRALEVDTIEGRRADALDEQHRRELADRAARRRQAGDDRVQRSADAWERHRGQLLEARDQLRDAARAGRGLPVGGGADDLMDRVRSVGDAVERGLDRAERTLDSLERVMSSIGGEGRPVAERSRTRDAGDERGDRPEERNPIGRFRELAATARRFAEDPLRDLDAGRRLRALRDELAAPEPPGRTRDGDVDQLEDRRQRALDALRERRAEDAPRASSSTNDVLDRFTAR
jgi:hypothetical protein